MSDIAGRAQHHLDMNEVESRLDALIAELIDENERLRADGIRRIEEMDRVHEANARLRAALQRIVAEAESDDGLTAWDGGDIAREALKRACQY